MNVPADTSGSAGEAGLGDALGVSAYTFDACPSTVANDLRRAPALAEQLKAASALMNTTSMDRAREASRVQAPGRQTMAPDRGASVERVMATLVLPRAVLAEP